LFFICLITTEIAGGDCIGYVFVSDDGRLEAVRHFLWNHISWQQFSISFSYVSSWPDLQNKKIIIWPQER